jgi:ATP adenylyltransferase
MDHLWTPWRFPYLHANKADVDCIFCAAATSTDDERALVIFRAQFNFVILNRYPYTSGHLMVAPYQHVSRLQAVEDSVTAEMMRLARMAETVLGAVYNPHGMNLGLNLGQAAGAGIEQHLHLHALPRWKGDANFMTSVANARIIPEVLEETYQKTKAAFARVTAGLT